MAWALPTKADKITGKVRYRGAYRDINGKTLYTKSQTWPTEREAVRAATIMEVEARDPGAMNPQNAYISWGEWWDEFRATRSWAYATEKSYRNAKKNHIAPHWANVRLCDIDELGVKRWINTLRNNGTPAPTILIAFTLFKASLNAAVGVRMKYNPAHRVRFSLPRTVYHRWLDVDEVRGLVHFLSTFRDQAAVLTGVSTGLRIGELSGLHITRNRLDVAGRRLYVAEQFEQSEGVIKGVKDKDPRVVPIPKYLVPVLERLIDEQPNRRTCGVRHLDGRCPGGALLFERNGKPLRGKGWAESVFRPAVRLAELEGRVVVHTMRHTYASWLVQSGVSMTQVGAVLGHSSERVTELYSHLAPGGLDLVAAALDSRFAASPTGAASAVQAPADEASDKADHEAPDRFAALSAAIPVDSLKAA